MNGLNPSGLKVVYVHPARLYERWLHYYYLDELAETLDIEFWDTSKIMAPDLKEAALAERNYVRHIDSWEGLTANLERIPRTSIFVTDSHVNDGNRRLYDTIARHARVRICFDFFANAQNTRRRIIVRQLIYIKVMLSKENIRMRLFRLKMKTFDISCRKTRKGRYRMNHPDYEEYVRSLSRKPLYEGERYMVYIDNYFPLHTDIRNREPYIRPEEMAQPFYDSMNRFFDAVEKKYGCKIKIAAHPAAMYTDNPYGGREIVRRRTPDLVRDCEAVLMHTSNAVSYALLNDKPVVLLVNSTYRKAIKEYRRVMTLSKLFKIRVYDTDMPLGEDDEPFRHIDPATAAAYKDKYLCASETENNGQLFVRHIRSIYNEVYGS